MARLFGAAPSLFLLWLQVPKEPAVLTLSASQFWKGLIKPSSLSPHIFRLTFFMQCVVVMPRFWGKKRHLRWQCFQNQSDSLLYFLNITRNNISNFSLSKKKKKKKEQKEKNLYFKLLSSLVHPLGIPSFKLYTHTFIFQGDFDLSTLRERLA